MAETTIKYISLDRLNLYHELEKNYIDIADAKSLKTVALSDDGKKLLFYRVSEPVGSTVPAYEIELPETDLSGVLLKVVNAINGNIPVFDTGGTIKDSGVALTDLAKKDYVDQKVSEEISKTGHLSKQIVTTLPTDGNAKENVIYMIKIESATGSDKYEEWTLIGGSLVKIGDTSTDISGYLTSEQAQALIATAKQEAITEAVSQAATAAEAKIATALAQAKAYTDTEVKKVADRVTTAEGNITTINGNITQINNTLNAHGDRLDALENNMPNISIASEDDIRAMFATS